MFNIALLFRPQIKLALSVVTVQVVILRSQLFIFLFVPPVFVLNIADLALPGAVLLPDPLLRLLRVFIGPVPLRAHLSNLPLALVDALPQLLHLRLERPPVLELRGQSQLQRVALLSQSRHQKRRRVVCS